MELDADDFGGKNVNEDRSRNTVVSLSRERLARQGDASGLVEEVVDFAARTGRRIAELERRIAELESLCDTDALTGLCNRRGLSTFFERARARCARYGHVGLVLWFDLNDFKRLNDLYGHAAGDAALVEVAARIGAHLRPSDCGARVGGDEFVVVCEPVDAAAADAIAGRFRAAIADAPMRVGGVDVRLGASVGWALFDGARSEADVLEAADRAMYREKAAGSARRTAA